MIEKREQLNQYLLHHPRLRRLIKIAVFLVLFLMVFYFAVPLRDPLFPEDYSTVVTDEEGQILRAFLNRRGQWHFPPDPGGQIPRKLEQAIVQFEDRYFYRHPGFNPVSLVRAAIQNARAGSVKSGASTLSMQVIRLAYGRKRTIWNKLLELLQAIKLEMRYSKKEILKLYVDHAPYGGNIVGYRAAALKYFKHLPDQLTWSQAATLAALPNAPGLMSPLNNRNNLIRKRDRLLRSLAGAGVMDENTLNSSLSEPAPSSAQPFFNHAPHLAANLAADERFNSRYVRTTLLTKYQTGVEELTAAHMKYMNALGVGSAAVLVAETVSGKVRVYVGSPDYFNESANGMVDGVLAPRSSGSILKPFLYALAMDEGLILPGTVVKDVPSYFGSFAPSNADKRFNGLVRARDALIRSLNVPAVRLLNAYGMYKFYVFLKNAGFSTIWRPPGDYGLTIILGGAETTLCDLAGGYRGLGNQGVFSPLRFLADETAPPAVYPQAPTARLISPESCWLVLNILKELKRPGAEFYWDQYHDQYPFAWKTGTSYGQRDAWAVGVSPMWTIAVWVGNFAGEGNTNLAGASCAGPLLFDIFNYLPKSPETSWFRQTRLDLAPVELCIDTGMAAGPFCPKTVRGVSPRLKKPLQRCPYHQPFYVDSEERFQVCSLCWEPGRYKRAVKLAYPPDVTQYLRESGVIVSDIPEHLPSCPSQESVQAMTILYPTAGASIWAPRDFDGTLQKITFSVAHRKPQLKVYWYLDKVYLGFTLRVHKMAVQLDSGSHRLEVVDQEGARTAVNFSAVFRK